MRDRVCQQATKIVLEPVFEADFLPTSFGFRPKRSATDALETIRMSFPRGRQFVFETDIRNFLANSRWPRFAPKAADAGFQSIHALPMRLRGDSIGALNLFEAEEGRLGDAPTRPLRRLWPTWPQSP